MTNSRRDTLLARLPTRASAEDLYDGDIVLHSSGTFLTVITQWHGELRSSPIFTLGVTALDPAAYSFSTDLEMHDEHEFRGDYLLLGELGTKRSLRLPRDTAGFSDFDTGGLFTRRSCIELLPESDAAPDSEFILEDGRPYHLGRAETLTPPAGYADGRFAGLLWRDYIRQRDQRGSTLALLG